MGRIRRFRQRYRDGMRRARGSLMWALLARQRRWVWSVFGLFAVVGVLNLLVASLTVAMVDKGIDEQTAPLGPFVARIAVLAVFAGFAVFGLAMVSQRLAYHMEFELRVWLYTRIQSAEAVRVDAVASGQLVTRALTDLHLLERALGLAPTVLGFLPIIAGISIVLFLLNPLMAIVAVAALPTNLYVLHRFRDRLWALSWADLNERAEVMRAIDEPVRGIRVAKAFGREEHEREKVAGVALRAYRYAMTRVRLLARYDIVLKLAPYLFNALLLGIGAHLLAADQLTLGTFLLAFQVSQMLTRIATIFSELASAWQYLRTAQSRLVEMLALGNRPSSTGARLPDPSTGLELTGVVVDIEGRRILDDLHVEVGPGELVVVTGAPGSGKSTLAAVAAGLLPIDAGTVVLDGVDLGGMDATIQRRAVRIVSEESVLFAGTLRDNLELGVPEEVDDATLLRALWAAGADEIVDALPGGLDGQVGDRGLTLSGGQRQRLALARALVDPPRILVLDDALAAVNPSLEEEILGRIRQHAPSTGLLCITRRAALGRTADRVVDLPKPRATTSAMDILDLPEPALAPDATELSRVLGDIRLSDEEPSIPAGVLIGDHRPSFGEVSRPFLMTAALALVALVVQTLAQFGPEALFGAVADVVRDDPGAANSRALALVGIAVIYAGASYAFRILAQRFNQGLIYLLRRRVFHRLTRLGIDYYDRNLPGQVATRVVHDLDTILDYLQGPGFMMLTMLGRLVIGLGLVVVISPSTAPVVAGIFLAIIVLTLVQLPLALKAYAWSRDELGRVTSRFEEDFTGRDEIRNLGAQRVQLEKFVSASWQRRRSRWWSAIVSNSYLAIMQTVGLIASALVLWRAGNEVLATELAVGTALTLRLLANSATESIGGMSDMWRQFLEVRVSWQRLRQPFDTDILPAEAPDAVACPPIAGEVTFTEVAFSYPYIDHAVLEDVSFTIRPQTVTALVGYTGTGKSSIAKLLSRMYDPSRGIVSVDGIDLRRIDLASYRARLGIVPQEAFLFSGTIASNIAYGRPDAGTEDIAEAAQAVGADVLLGGLPGGYDHPVEEEGRNLSAARRQLIALARAWLARPDVLVLDEATSCLDPALEAAVLKSLARLECTTLMITHRENVALLADEIVVLHEGRVVAAGTARSVARDPGFRRLWANDEGVKVGRGGRSRNGRKQ